MVRQPQFFGRHKIAEEWGTSAVEEVVVAEVSADLREVGEALEDLAGQGVDIRRMVAGDMVAAAWDVVVRQVTEAVTTADDDWVV